MLTNMFSPMLGPFWLFEVENDDKIQLSIEVLPFQPGGIFLHYLSVVEILSFSKRQKSRAGR